MSFDNIKLEKGLYTTGKSFTDALEYIDPSENYTGTSLEGLDAYERQLKRFDIKVSGPNSDTISKFFKTSDSSVLFPEYISRAVKTGALRKNNVEKLIATTTEIDSLDYRSISFDDDMDLSLAKTNEGASFTECTVSLSSELTPLKKYGKMLTGSYEAIKFQKLDVFSIVLKKIGETIANDQFNDALNIIANNEKCKPYLSDLSEITYDKLVDIWNLCYPYEMNIVVATKDVFAKILKLNEMRDATAGLNFHSTGNIITPFGAELMCIDSKEEISDTIVGLNNNNCLEKVQACGIVTEFDKLIDRQIERVAISTIVGFSPIYGDAAVIALNP